MRNLYRRLRQADRLDAANDTIERLLKYNDELRDQIDTITLLAEHNAAQRRASQAAHSNDLRRLAAIEADFADACWELEERRAAARWWITRAVTPTVVAN